MVGDELPCHENLFIQQLEGGALDPGQDDFMGRGPLEASVKIWFCQLCVSTGSILENLWGRCFFIHMKTVCCRPLSLSHLSTTGPKWKQFSLIVAIIKMALPCCAYRANVNGHLSARAQPSLWEQEACGATALSNFKQMRTNSCDRVPGH